MSLCIIPARGGSKRIPKKNIKFFDGYPMIYYAIKVAKESNLFAKIIVSTDDEEIAEIAMKNGAEVPFLRPKSLSDDFTGTMDVIRHGIKAVEEIFELKPIYTCCIYPCVPTLKSKDIINAYQELENSKRAKFSFPIIEYSPPIQRALIKDDDGVMKPFQIGHERARTQDLDKTYHDAGQFYWGKTDYWLKYDSILSNGLGVVFSRDELIDIDTFDDWKKAEYLYKLKRE